MDPGLSGLSVPGDTLAWLLDPEDPSRRYLALTKLLGKDEDSAVVRASRVGIPRNPPAVDILQAQYPQGYWMHSGIGASPRYRATLWQILILAQLGLGRCGPLDRAVEHIFSANQRKDGAFRASKEPDDAPIDLNASLLWALETLGYGDEAEVRSAWQWIIGEVEQRTMELGRRPQVSAWEVKVVWALNARLGGQDGARQDGAGLDGARLDALRARLAESLLARRPTPEASDPAWFRLVFPLTEGADFLQWLTVLVDAGYGDDLRLRPARIWLNERRQPEARWSLERIPGKLWADVGAPGEFNKWITIRALAVVP